MWAWLCLTGLLLCGFIGQVISQEVIINPQPGPPPVYLSGTNLIWSASFGSNLAYLPFCVVASTNIAAPSTNWLRVLTNAADQNGKFSVTLPIEPDKPYRFYRIAIPVP